MQKYYLSLLISCLFVSANAQYIWVNKALFPDSGRLDAACFTINSKGYMVCGQLKTSPTTFTNQTWEYNPLTDSWARKHDYPHTSLAGTYFSVNGLGYQIGGGDSIGHYFSDNYAYNPVNDSCIPKASFPENGVGGAFQFVINGMAYVGAGVRNTAVHGVVSAYSYNPVSDTWASIANYPGLPTIGLVSFAIDSFGYAGMGGDGNGNFYTEMYRYNPATNSWTPIAPFPGKGRFATHSPIVINGRAYVGGGATNLNGTNNYYDLSDYYMYDPVANTWSASPGLQGPSRYSAMSFTFGDSAYLACGYNHDGGVFYRIVDEFKPADKVCTAFDTSHVSVTDTLFITVTVGVSPNTTPNTLDIYPNPGHNQLYINTGDYAVMSGYSLKITNPLGQTVFTNAVSQQLFAISTSTWAAGVYYLQVINPSSAVVATKEIVVQ